MPPMSPALHLGIQTLGEVIQLTPASPALAIITTSRNILQMIDDDQSGSLDVQRLALKVLEIAVAYSDGVKKLDESDIKDPEMRSISSNLHIFLESISYALLKKHRGGFFTRVLSRSSTRQRIKGWEADLDHFSSLLATQIQLRSAKLSHFLLSESDEIAAQELTAMEESVESANQEALDLIRSQVLKETRKRLHKRYSVSIFLQKTRLDYGLVSSFGHFPPAASPIFYGRSHHVEWLVDSLVKAPAYHAILGPGGIGKTSVSLNMLHDPRIVEAYGKHRYFLACETTTDASGIVAGLADIFGLNEHRFVKLFKGLCDVLNSHILFLLDNFETPWERKEVRQEVEDLLTDLSSIPNLSIVITIRGAERPRGIMWSRPFLPVLGPLDPSAARQTFVTIADIGDQDPDLTCLLEAVECIPLAITLLAAQASYTSCAFLLEQWETRKTAMITRGWDNRLSSLDVSISLSLTCSRFISNPQALSLLQILSLLPDGATLEELRHMTTDDLDIHQSVSTLLQVALATTVRHDRFHVLAPIREYVQSNQAISTTLLLPVFSYHAELSRYAEASQWTTEGKNVDDRLSPCIGNIHSVIMICLSVEPLADEAIDASIKVASFRAASRFGSIGHLLAESVKSARERQKAALLAACLEKVGLRMCYTSTDRLFALQCLEESVKISRSLPIPENSDQLVSALRTLAWCYEAMWRNKEALQFAQEAVDSVTSSTSVINSALAYLRLGYGLLNTGDFSGSQKALELADSHLDSGSSPLFTLRMMQCYMNLYFGRDMYKQCLTAANFALSFPGSIESGTQRGRLLIRRAMILTNLSRFEDARRDYLEAIQFLASSGSAIDIADAYCLLGLTYVARGALEDAKLCIETAYQFPLMDVTEAKLASAVLELFHNHLEQSQVYLNLYLQELATAGQSLISPHYFGWLGVQCQLQIQQRAADSVSSCVLAVITAYRLQDRGCLAMSILCLGDTYLFVRDDVAASKACYQANLNLVRYLGCWRWVANSLLRLGVTDYLQGDRTLAVRRVYQALRFYEETDGKPWVECCKNVLRTIEGGGKIENIPSFPAVSLHGF